LQQQQLPQEGNIFLFNTTISNAIWEYCSSIPLVAMTTVEAMGAMRAVAAVGAVAATGAVTAGAAGAAGAAWVAAAVAARREYFSIQYNHI
jgi:hypothetical protein